MIVYGRNPVREALRGKRRVQRVYATERASREVLLAEVESRIVDAGEVERRAESPDHQGICAEVEAFPYSDADSLLAADDALVIALDEVQDPNNLGAVCGVGVAAGCAGVVLRSRGSGVVTPAVCRAWAGGPAGVACARRGVEALIAPGLGAGGSSGAEPRRTTWSQVPTWEFARTTTYVCGG